MQMLVSTSGEGAAATFVRCRTTAAISAADVLIGACCGRKVDAAELEMKFDGAWTRGEMRLDPAEHSDRVIIAINLAPHPICPAFEIRVDSLR